MYVIKVENDNTLRASCKQRIMHRSKLVDTLIFLVNPIYNGLNITDYTVVLEYISPISREIHSEALVRCEENYKEYLKYIIPVDTKLTKECGKVELHLSFICSDLDDEGNSVQRVRKTSDITIDIIPISAWSNVVADGTLTAVDQKIIELDARIKALDDLTESMDGEMVDNIVNKDGILQLTANGKPIGDAVEIETCNGECIEDGIPVVDFNNYNDTTTPEDKEYDNVIEF